MVLAKNDKQIVIDTGGERIELSRTPATTSVPVGIAFDEIRMRALFAQNDNELEDAAAGVGAESELDEEGDEDSHIE
jgi:hypothetical protein